jgi:uridine monophosphate synthetase
MLPVKQLDSIVISLHEIGAVRFGEFKLHSGRISPIYLDLRLLASYPAVLRRVAEAYAPILFKLNFDLLAAMPLAGLPIGTAVSLHSQLPLIYPRQTLKAYGTGKPIEGAWSARQRVVAIDDVITSGASLLHGIAVLEDAGLQISDVVVLVDRQQGGRETLSDQGYTLYSAITLSQMLAILENKKRITPLQHAHVLKSLDRNEQSSQ